MTPWLISCAETVKDWVKRVKRRPLPSPKIICVPFQTALS